MNSGRPIGGLSIDCDNLWSYLRTRGDSDWDTYPSFLDVAIPRALAVFSDLKLKVTFFIVGRDAEREDLQGIWGDVAAAGHEIGNHSYDHRVDFHRLSPAELRTDFDEAESAIANATGHRPVGFRGPSFRDSATIRRELISRDYEYASSDFPTILGPLARAYHFSTSNLNPEQKQLQKDLFGGFSEGVTSLRPHFGGSQGSRLAALPVTTFPALRLPIHMTYVNFAADSSEAFARMYLRAAVRMCRLRRIPLNFLLHATDFIGADDSLSADFLPGMRRSHDDKLHFLKGELDFLSRRHDLRSLREYSSAIFTSAPV